jgi:8-oxo-dGTP diphosphatase
MSGEQPNRMCTHWPVDGCSKFSGPTGLERVGHFTFRFPARPEWDQVVHVFVAREWKGSPKESPEMRPEWFGVKGIPYEAMWADDAHWLPWVLEGKRVRGWFRFREDGETIEALQVQAWDGEEA